MITASSGDGGYGVEFPAASQYVTAVGGTTPAAERRQDVGERDGLERHGLRLLGLRAEARLADRHGLCETDGRRRLCRRRSEHRRRGLRLGRSEGGRRLVPGRRHEPRLPARRRGVRAHRETRASTTARSRTRTPPRSTTSPREATAAAAPRTSAPRAAASTARRASARRTGSPPSPPPRRRRTSRSTPRRRAGRSRRAHATTYGVTLAPVNGFSGSAALSVSGLPSGVTSSFSPASVSASARLPR